MTTPNQGRARAARQRHGAHLARLDLGQARHQGVDRQRDLVADQVRHGRCAAAVGHVQQLGPRALGQRLARHVRRGAVAERTEAERLRGRLAGDVRHRADAGLRIRQDHERRAAGDGDVFVALDRVVVQVRIQQRVRRERRRAGDHEGIAIGRSAGDGGSADAGVGARLVFNHDGLAQARAQLHGEEAADDIGGSARRERHHHGDRLVRIGLCRGHQRRCGQDAQREGAGDVRQHGRLAPVLRSLFERVRQLQQCVFLAIAPDDLDAHGQARVGEAAGHRDRRMAGQRQVVARPHPVDVVVHRRVFDAAHGFLLDRERQHLAARPDQEFMGLHEGLHAREQGSAVALGLEDGRRRLLQAQFDVPDDRVFQQMPVVAQHRF
ncbi:hypothetical protein G6F68_010606 [Rhizopus microsporus]|nr:hypothetical protein G6F68_010606 [Rhizopus microsporus]